MNAHASDFDAMLDDDAPSPVAKGGLGFTHEKPVTGEKVDWYHRYAKTADAILFLEGRVRFVDRSGKPPLVWCKRSKKHKESSPGCGSMLLAWGEENVAALRRMDAAGHGHLIIRPSADDFGDLI